MKSLFSKRYFSFSNLADLHWKIMSNKERLISLGWAIKSELLEGNKSLDDLKKQLLNVSESFSPAIDYFHSFPEWSTRNRREISSGIIQTGSSTMTKKECSPRIHCFSFRQLNHTSFNCIKLEMSLHRKIMKILRIVLISIDYRLPMDMFFKMLWFYLHWEISSKDKIQVETRHLSRF